MLRQAKVVFYVLLTGLLSGGYIVHRFEADHIRSFAERGFCGKRDPDHTFYWSMCVDQQYADAIAKASVEYDQETASVLGDMEKHQPKKAKRK